MTETEEVKTIATKRIQKPCTVEKIRASRGRTHRSYCDFFSLECCLEVENPSDSRA